MSNPSISTSVHARSAAARAFVHSLNILVKYARMYGFDHKRTEAQFDTSWNELQQALPKGGGGFLMGVSDNKLLVDGLPLESGQAERSFAQLLNAAGLASIHFSSDVTMEDFARLVRAFAVGGSKAQDLAKQVKETLGGSKSSIKVNEVKFVAADPLTGDVSIAAQIAAQTLGPDFKNWLNEPQKLLQLIAAAEGANSGIAPGATPFGPGGDADQAGAGGWGGARDGSGQGSGTGTGGTGTAGGGGTGTVGTGTGGAGTGGTGAGGGGTGPGGFGPGPGGGVPGGGGGPIGGVVGGVVGGTVPLQEQEVVQAIRLLTRFSEVTNDPNAKSEDLLHEVNSVSPNTRLNLQSLLANLATNVSDEKQDGSTLMKAAEHMAIRFALERYTKGEVRVNAVHQMMEHMSRQMDRLRQILRSQEEKMARSGILVESHADILDRMFWAEVPENGKRSVLLSNEAPCVPARNVRQYLDTLKERGDREGISAVLENYLTGLRSPDLEIRKKTATGMAQMADLYGAAGTKMLVSAIMELSEPLRAENEAELQSLVSAAFVRVSQEANTRRNYAALEAVLTSIEKIGNDRPLFAKDLLPRIGIENRIPEYVEEALRAKEAPPELIQVLRRTPSASTEHLADRFFRCFDRETCDSVISMVEQMGPRALELLRETLRTGAPGKASSTVGLLSRLDVATLLELLPGRLPEMSRFYHDVVVRQIAYGAAPDRGRTLVELLELLDKAVLPQTVDEIGMSGDQTASAPLIAMAQEGQSENRTPFLQVKAIESLGRLREPEAAATLHAVLSTRRMFKWASNRELRISAAQAICKIDPRYNSQIHSESGLSPEDLALGPLDPSPECKWVRQRRYERFVLAKAIPANLIASGHKAPVMIRELSLGGGLAGKDANLRLPAEGMMEFSAGLRGVKAQVLIRRSKQMEFGFEIVLIDLDSRGRLRKLLTESLGKAPETKSPDWDGKRNV